MSNNNLSNKSYKTALGFLRNQAIEAHINKDIGKVRHIVAIFFEDYYDKFKKDLLLSEQFWAFILGIYWAKNDSEFEIIINAYNEFFTAKSNELEEDLQSILLQTIYNAFTFNSKHIKVSASNLYKIIDKYQNIEFEVEEKTALLLAIQIIWYYEPNDIWEQIVFKYKDFLHKKSSHDNNAFLNEIGSLYNNTKVFEWLYYPERTENISIESKIEEWFHYDHVQKELLKAHFYFFDLDISKSESEIKRIANKVKFHDEYFPILQNLINYIRTNICSYYINIIQRKTHQINMIESINQNLTPRTSAYQLNEKKINELKSERVSNNKLLNNWEKQFIGFQRYERFLINNTYKIFKKQRQVYLKENLYRLEQGINSPSKRLSCIRLILLMTLSDIKDFEILSLVHTLELERDFSLHIGLFNTENRNNHYENQALFTSLLNSLKSSNLFPKRKLQEAFNNLELIENSKFYIRELITACLNSYPYQYNYAIELFDMISDCMPEDEELLSELAAWSNKYSNFTREKVYGLIPAEKFDHLSLWKHIIENIILSNKIWEILDKPIQKYFYTQAYYDLVPELMIVFLIYSPIEFSTKWCDNVIKKIEQNIENNIQSDLSTNIPTVFYNASIEKRELKEYAKKILSQWLILYPNSYEIEYDNKILESDDNYDELFINNCQQFKAIQNTLIKELLNFCDSIKKEYKDRQKNPRLSRSIGFGGDHFTREFKRYNWEYTSKTEIDNILRSIRSAIKSDPNEEQMRILLTIMRAFIDQGNQYFREKIFKILIGLWSEQKKFYSMKDGIDESPFSNFRIEGNIDNIVQYLLIVLAADCYKYANSQVRGKIRSFVIRFGMKNSYYTQHVLAVYLYGMLLGKTINERVISKAAFELFFSNIENDLNRQNEAAKVLLNILGEKIKPANEIGLELLIKFKDFEKILIPIFSWMDRMYLKPHPDLRKNIAKLTKLFINSGFQKNELFKIRDTLQNDIRARVRRVFIYENREK